MQEKPLPSPVELGDQHLDNPGTYFVGIIIINFKQNNS